MTVPNTINNLAIDPTIYAFAAGTKQYILDHSDFTINFTRVMNNPKLVLNHGPWKDINIIFYTDHAFTFLEHHIPNGKSSNRLHHRDHEYNDPNFIHSICTTIDDLAPGRMKPWVP